MYELKHVLVLEHAWDHLGTLGKSFCLICMQWRKNAENRNLGNALAPQRWPWAPQRWSLLRLSAAALQDRAAALGCSLENYYVIFL